MDLVMDMDWMESKPPPVSTEDLSPFPFSLSSLISSSPKQPARSGRCFPAAPAAAEAAAELTPPATSSPPAPAPPFLFWRAVRPQPALFSRASARSPARTFCARAAAARPPSDA
ncbi:hypothetical protein PVAP13_5KG209207 [Panicum virgatum]|uniref:Uncharacterized protein n=1 Tax=Panicum virgatum TaxID=38727 RepID=A0A8T0SFA4_PANVG|nr:hypothetical protein PVAP13_5KG209207 [Panicum virgatum]